MADIHRIGCNNAPDKTTKQRNTMNQSIRDIIRGGVARANESTNETELLARFGRYLSKTEKADFVLFLAVDPSGAFAALGLRCYDLDGFRYPSNRDLTELLEAQDLCEDHKGVIRDKTECRFIESLDAYALGSDCVSVRTGRRQTEWRLADGDGYFVCELCEEAFCEDKFTAVDVDGQRACLEWNEDSLYYWESDGGYHLEPEPEETNDLGLRGYHDEGRSPIKSGEAVSIELEVVVNSPDNDFGDAVRRVADAAEEDSSLPNNGAEIIFGSTTLSEIEGKIARVLAAIKPFNAVGHIEGNAGVGMHVSVSRSGWDITNATLARILLLVCENQSFFEIIAQRKETNWAYYGIKTKGQALKAAKENSRKYEAVSVRDFDRVEFRLFRSSVRKDRLMKNVETVASVIRFCKSVLGHNSATLLGYKNYLRDNAKKYPHLVAFLTEKGAI